MKTRNERRRGRVVWAAVSAGGMLAAGAEAAPLGSNLVTNPSFENVDLASTGRYNGPEILDWVGTAAFAYSHDGSRSSAGTVGDYANGLAPAGAGHWYFGAANATPEIRGPGQFFQDIDVSGGATGPLIGAGQARYSLSAFLSNYAADLDPATVHVQFRNAAGGSLGTAQITDPDVGPNNVWQLYSNTGPVPVGTSSVRVSVFGTQGAGAFPTADAYVDLVDFRVDVVPEPSMMGVVLAGMAAVAMARKRRREGA